ncbi:MAG TPA: DUF1800 domain-containing protein [Terriglobales bacterium]|nr:DUF1800 domain-containing protein [Terriglobales bacterium]
MKLESRQIATAVLLLGFAGSALLAAATKKDKQPATAQMDQQRRAVHVLNRLTFGPRPGDVERVQAMGVDHWIDQQLHPERIDDDAVDARLTGFRTLGMNPRELMENFPSGEMIKAVADGKRALPSDPLKRAVYQAQLDRYAEKQERKAENGGSISPPIDAAAKPNRASDEGHTYSDQKAQQLLEMPPDQRFKAALQMSADERNAVTASLRSKREEFLEGMKPRERETLLALNDPRQVVDGELVQAKLLRAIYGERQLQEVMDDFWFNHFNVFIGKGVDRYLLTSYERDVIRPHSMGKFEDLLVATAQSPAMLFYLDNWLSVGPNSDVANGIPKRNDDNWKKRARIGGPVNQAKGKRSGLNENYGRELMELHTLGVNGGYTQKDVTEVARVFTGWTLNQPRQGGGFTFEERMHEPGDKMVLGHRIKAKGEKEGFEVLHILAHHPATAKFVCTKLAVRFVSDDPPPSLVDRMAQTFLKKDGDIRQVLKTMFDSPEFWATDTYRAKVKTPLEFTVSAVRASGAEVSDAVPLSRQLQNMGMPAYGAQPPTGYSMKASTWVNSSALLERMNFALALTAGKLRGVQVNSATMTSQNQAGESGTAVDPSVTLADLEIDLLHGDVSTQTHDTIAARLQDPLISQRRLDDPSRAPNIAAIAGLLLGSPEFQKK